PLGSGRRREGRQRLGRRRRGARDGPLLEVRLRAHGGAGATPAQPRPLRGALVARARLGRRRPAAPPGLARAAREGVSAGQSAKWAAARALRSLADVGGAGGPDRLEHLTDLLTAEPGEGLVGGGLELGCRLLDRLARESPVLHLEHRAVVEEPPAGLRAPARVVHPAQREEVVARGGEG